MDTDGSTLIRFESELPPQSASPFILAVEFVASDKSKSWVFEVWADNEKLLVNLGLSTAVAAFLHICFIFDLKFNKVSLKIFMTKY